MPRKLLMPVQFTASILKSKKMLELSAKIRKEVGKKVKSLRAEDKLPAILYGPKIKNIPLELDYESFKKVYREAGGSSLISLKIEGKKETYQVLIHDIQKDPLDDKFLHIDFFQPSLKEKVEAKVPLVFEGEAEAVKKLGGTLLKNITEVEVKALPQNLPHEIRVKIDRLKTFEDHIKILDLEVSREVEILKNAEEIVVSVVPPEKVEEELEKPIEEKVEEVEEEKEKEKEEKEEEEKEEKEKVEEGAEEMKKKEKGSVAS